MALSQLAETLIGSEIIKLAAEVSEKIRQGKKIYNYTIGDFDPAIFPIPEAFEQGIIDAYRRKITNYPAADGIPELRKAVSGFISKYQGLTYSPDEILISGGGRPLIYAVYRTIVDPGDKVLYAVPSWNNNHYTHFVQGEHIQIVTRPEDTFMPVADEIRPHLHDVVLITLCSPLNPTGTTFRKEQLKEICDMVVAENQRRGPEQKKIYILFDQIYWMLTFGNTRHHDPVSIAPELKPYTIFVDGMSKAFAATGVRVGWSMGPAPIISKMKAILSHVGAWSPMPEQYAAAGFLQQFDAIDNFLATFKHELYSRLHALHLGFQQLKEKGYAVDSIDPEAAIYLTVRFNLEGKRTPAGNILASQAEIGSYILEEGHLAVVPFSAFGAASNSPWYRLSVGTCKREEIPEMFQQLEQILSALT